jgi:hypothetical protein
MEHGLAPRKKSSFESGAELQKKSKQQERQDLWRVCARFGDFFSAVDYKLESATTSSFTLFSTLSLSQCRPPTLATP